MQLPTFSRLEDLPLSLFEKSDLRDAIDMEFHLAVDQIVEECGIVLTQERMEAAYERIVPYVFMRLLRERGIVSREDGDVTLNASGKRILEQIMHRKITAAFHARRQIGLQNVGQCSKVSPVWMR